MHSSQAGPVHPEPIKKLNHWYLISTATSGVSILWTTNLKNNFEVLAPKISDPQTDLLVLRAILHNEQKNVKGISTLLYV